MSHRVEIPLTSPYLRPGVQGLANAQFLLDLEVEGWLNDHAPGWTLLGGNHSWEHVPEMQVWFNYRDATTGNEWKIGPAVFVFTELDHALLFKLTWR
jgi:hypothetical protein